MKNLPHTGVQCSSENLGFRLFQERLDVFSKEDHKIGYSIYFSLSKANYGNYRYWFICPNSSCSRRCRKLVEIERSKGISYFLCRQCLNLVYRSQNRIELDCIIDRKWKLIHSLGCDTTWIWDHQRPKGMHRKTFERIRKEIECLDNEATYRIAALCR